jgi:hypothetical protein
MIFKMKNSIVRKIVSVIAVLFSLLSIIEGLKVLLGISNQKYIVFVPLLIYNLVMAFVGLIVGGMIWFNSNKVFKRTSTITIIHLIVLITLVVIFITNGPVAPESIKAMVIRSGVWLAITLITWKTTQPNETNIVNTEQLNKKDIV